MYERRCLVGKVFKVIKMDYGTVVYLMCLTSLIASVHGRSAEIRYPKEDCLTCICEGSSECDDDIECRGGSTKYCGPYLISHIYWLDGGQYGDDFLSCATYRPCAEATVRAHMQKWASDCNGDNKIDCWDFAKIHKAGGPSCNTTAVYNTDYWMRFEACYSQML